MMKNNSQSIFYGKKILIGITGSIAAYKIPELVRCFIKLGAQVKIILTKSASNFVSPLTLSTVSKNDVLTDLYDESSQIWHNHVNLGLWADIFLIAPCTANTISKMVAGTCDNLLLATFLSSKCPIFCAPAMDRDMYLNTATIKNLQTLKKRGVNILKVDSGELASGLFGLGRMRDINNIINDLEIILLSNAPLNDKRVLITAGPTYEKIDPVRFIGNFSSGKTGCELAKCAASLGATVDLVIGPSHQEVHHPLINRYNVETANEMLNVSKKKFKYADIAIFSAAVSDFKCETIYAEKIKKKSLTIKTKKNPDIIKSLSQFKKNQFIVGFALETENELENAINKMKSKKMDLIILNSLNSTNSCFSHDSNKIKIIDNSLNIKDYPIQSKKEVAHNIFNEILFQQSFLLTLKKH